MVSFVELFENVQHYKAEASKLIMFLHYFHRLVDVTDEDLAGPP